MIAASELAAPLPGDSAVGRDLTYEPAFQALQLEVDKTTGLAGQAADWQRVRDECVRLLREETKDLRCASWLVVAMTHLEGWSGVTRGLSIYQALLEAHWDAMYPPVKRARARVAIVEWVWEGLRQTLSSREVDAAHAEEVRALLPALRAIDDVLASKLGDQAPSAGQLRSLLREKVESVPEPAPTSPPPATIAEAAKPQAPPPPPPAPAPVAAPAPPPPPAVVDPNAPVDLDRFAGTCRSSLLALAQAERAAEPSAERAYRLARIGAWLHVAAAPDVEGGRSFIKPPREADVRDLRELAKRGNSAALRDAAEDMLLEHVFWLDLHRFSSTALERLGPSFAAARRAVVSETLAFLERVPGLESMCFRDGRPFADEETAAWLRGARPESAPSLSAGFAPDAEAGGADDPVAALLTAARAGIAEGRAGGALAEALSLTRALASVRSRFRARLGLGKLAIEGGKEQVGLAILEQLLLEVDATLEAWEPELCAAAIRDFLAASARSPGDGEGPREGAERRRLLFRRLLQLNPASALHLER